MSTTYVSVGTVSVLTQMEGLKGIIRLSGKPCFGQGMSGNFMLKILNEPCLLSLSGNSGRLTWVRLQQPQEQRNPVLQVHAG